MTTDDSTLLIVLGGDPEPPTEGPAAAKAASAVTPPATATPDRGHLHEVPVDLVETLEACWTRCRMAGLERARAERWDRFSGLASTVITTAAGTSAWAYLHGQTQLATTWTVMIVTAGVAVAVAVERAVTQRLQDDRTQMDEVAGAFHPLHLDLMRAVSTCRLDGTMPPEALMTKAAETRAAHVATMSQERPSFDRAKATVDCDLRALDLLR
jgi:hypothetical protein